MIPHQRKNHITRSLECSSCHEVTKIRMETNMLRFDWSCPSCGRENLYEDLGARSMVGSMRPEDLRK